MEARFIRFVACGSGYLKQIAEALGIMLNHLISGTPVAHADEDIQFPHSLAAFARSESLSFPQTLMILKFQQQVVAFRNDSGAESVAWRQAFRKGDTVSWFQLDFQLLQWTQSPQTTVGRRNLETAVTTCGRSGTGSRRTAFFQKARH